MRRREFITLLGGAAAAWPLAARAEQRARVPTVGFFSPNTHSAAGAWTAAFVKRLREVGWIEGSTIAIEFAGVKDTVIGLTRSSRSSFGSSPM